MLIPALGVLLFSWLSVPGTRSTDDFCALSADCVQKVQRMARDTNRFWFGDRWRLNCAARVRQSANKRAQQTGSAVECVNPRELAPFPSLGSRLFRVTTFTNAYLARLRLFPRLRFQPQSGAYRACGHNFEVQLSRDEELFGVDAHPSMRPVPTFQAQNAPDITWPELHPNESYTVAMVDVGFGQLNYLAVDFPRDTKVLVPYRPLDNFRPHQPTPLAVLIFEAPKGAESAFLQRMETEWARKGGQQRDERLFDLGQFMIESGLERGLVGLSWALVDGDAFGIERQRVRGGMPDNCHSLVLQKLLRDNQWHFVETFPLAAELDSSLSVSLVRPRASVRACCFASAVEEDQVYLDPLDDDLRMPSVALRHSTPSVSSMRPLLDAGEENAVYQRSSRHYFVVRDERFSLVLFNPARRSLHWMLADVPAEALSAGSLEGAVSVAPYLAPVPSSPGECLFAVFALFRQPRGALMGEFFNADHPLRQRQCEAECAHRDLFDVEQFKALHRLHVSAMSWMRVCFDLFEAAHQISLIQKRPESQQGVDRASKQASAGRKGARSDAEIGPNDRTRLVAGICARFNATLSGQDSTLTRAECASSSQSPAPALLAPILLTLLLLLLPTYSPFEHLGPHQF